MSLALLGLCFAAEGRAQSVETRASARELAVQGSDAYDRGEYARAVDLFERAQSLIDAPTHLLWLGRAHAKLGRLLRARELFLQVVRAPLKANAPAAFRAARREAADELNAVDALIARLVIHVEPLEGEDQPLVTLDGQQVPAALLGVTQLADPGRHEIVAAAPGYRTLRMWIVLREGDRDEVRLKLTPDPEARAEARKRRSAAPPSPVVPDAPKSNKPRTAPRAELPTRRVRLTSAGGELTFHRQSGAGGWYHTPICTTPCETNLIEGVHVLGVSDGDDEVVTTSARIEGDTQLRGDLSYGRGANALGLLLLTAGPVVGISSIYLGAKDDGDSATIATGVGVLLGSVLAGILLVRVEPSATITATPLRTASHPGGGELADRRPPAPQGMSLSVTF